MATLKFIITFESGVSDPAISIADQKFNKKGWLGMQWDDGSHGVYKAQELFKNYGYHYTDGCGNNVNYRASVGMNKGTGVPGSPDYNEQVPQSTQLLSLISDGFDIENHSYFHRGTPENPPSDGVKAQALGDTVLEDDVIYQYAQYKMQSFIVPSDFNGYAIAAKQKDYISVLSTDFNTFDSLPYYKFNGTNEFKIPAQPTQNEFLCLLRDYTDQWNNAASVQSLKNQVDALALTTGNYYALFTHSNLEAIDYYSGFVGLFDHIKNTLADNFLICSVREALDYRAMRLCPVSKVLSGNTLTVSINTNNLPVRTRWKDISLNVVSNKSIVNVMGIGFDSVNFNSATGLVNGFSQKTVWTEGDNSSNNPPPADVQELFLPRGKFVAQN